MEHTFQGTHSKIETDTWVLELSRKLTDEEWDQYQAEINTPGGKLMVWDEKGREFSMAMCLFIVRQICPDIEATSWTHEPMHVFVRSIGLPDKVYVIEHAMGFSYASQKAKETWREQYNYLGIKATIVTIRLATKRDLKGMM